VLSKRTAELEKSQQQLSVQAADLREQDRYREQFLAALGHELRNPMAAIQGSLSLISTPDDRSARALAVLQRQTRHMNRLVDDLLDIARVRYGKLRLEPSATRVPAVSAGRAGPPRRRTGTGIDARQSACRGTRRLDRLRQ